MQHAGMLVALALLGVAAAACAGSPCAEGDAADVAMLQHMQRRSGKAGDVPASKLPETRLLATIPKLPPLALPGGLSLPVRSAIPVFPPGGGAHLAFVADYSDATWPLVYANGSTPELFCEATDGSGHRSPIDAYGAETPRRTKWTIVLKCAWPEKLRDQACHDVQLVLRGSVIAKYQACHDPTLLTDEKYELAACIEPLHESPSNIPGSGILQLPQWLEYSLMKGVQHFLIYTLQDTDARQYAAMRPYLEAGLLTQIRLEVPLDLSHGPHKTQTLVINDCLTRLRGRAKWLLPSIDTDEYMVFNSSDDSRKMRYQDALEDWIGDRAIHAVTFARTNFLHPKMPYQQLQIESTRRELRPAALCPKDIVRTDLVNALFVHWPTSFDNNSVHVGVPKEQLIVFHYRLTEVNQSRSLDDSTLAVQSSALDDALRARYGQRWSAFAPKMLEAHAQPAAAMASTSIGVEVEAPIEDIPGGGKFGEYVADLAQTTVIDDYIDALSELSAASA